LLRPGRFDRQVVVPIPDLKGREAILKVHTRRLPWPTPLTFPSWPGAPPDFPAPTSRTWPTKPPSSQPAAAVNRSPCPTSRRPKIRSSWARSAAASF
jgi:hypothetical protein